VSEPHDAHGGGDHAFDALPIDPDPIDAPPVRRFGPYRPDPNLVAAVAAGGALGGAARFGVSQALSGPSTTFPWGTLLANLSGSFLLGALLVLLLERFPPSRSLRALLGTGFCGAYTTMSTFAVDTDLLVRDGRAPVATAYVLATVAGGLVAMWAGMRLVRLVPRHPPFGHRPRGDDPGSGT
jgi:CrcB protein